MAYTREQIQQLFQSSFDLTKWTDIIVNFFMAREVKSEPKPLDIDNAEGTGYELGYLDTSDTYRISFFYLRLNRSVDRRKVGLRKLITPFIKIDSDAGIGVFDDGKHWRLSFITDLKNEKTSPKRYTFVFGDRENGYRTAVDRFMELQRKGISFENIKDAFSVEALTKEFYNELFDWYTWALKEDTGVYFPNNPNTPADDRENLDTKMIRLITRLMFVWFIKQKKLVPDAIFNPEEVSHWLKDFDAQSMTSANYYQAILQNLFFATLNRPIRTPIYDKDGRQVGEERRGFAHLQGKQDVKSLYRYQDLFKISEDKILSIFEFIPFINGGLFECLDKNKTSDGVDYAFFEDGFSRNSTIRDGRWTKRAFIPNKLFFDPEKGIISIFYRYNFTVEENSPSEQQVALDPELLGKVFENLLGIYNPETRETARNQSGSFYTPREIVNYMVDRSLEAYLGDTDEVKALFREDFVYDEDKRAFYTEVISRLKKIKVFDPACGSGAFPIGMLNRIVEVMQNLNAIGTKYDLKLQIMENCIFGGDIQTIAAQITKLRFFISLICDCQKNDNADNNYGIPNLPNLETHFITCDSLIGLKKPQLQLSLFEQDVIELKEKLKAVRHEHFTAKTVYQKTKLRDKDRELRNELAHLLSDDNIMASEDAKQMAAWNPYDQNGKSSFFDSEWMFGIKDGFDVVIGNPPYIQLQNNGGALGELYAPCGFDTFARTGDIYSLFYERGHQLLKAQGHLCFITSNKWMRAGYGEKTRQFFVEKCNPLLLIDFAGVKVFESATVDTNILLFSKAPYNGKTISTVTKGADKNSLQNLSVFVQQNHTECKFTADSWVILSPIEQSIKNKIESVGTPLKDWDINIYRGVLTGCNEAFIIPTTKRDEILANCKTDDERSRTAELIRPILRGRDIKRYGYEWAGLYLIATFPSKNYDIEQYPAVKQHLLSFGMERLEQTGKDYTVDGQKVKARKKTNNKWFETQDSISYWEDFYKPKIVYPNMTKYMPFLYDDKSFLTNQKCFIITGERMAFLTAFFNSSLFKFCFRDSFPELQGGTRELSKIFFDKIPVKEISEDIENQFRTAVVDIQNEYTKKKAIQIDEMIFDLYNLNTEERKTIGFVEIR